jgi:cysteine desulfurase/selenocysteine lyase
LKNDDVAYLDHAATSLTPDSVIQDIQDYYYNYRSNVHRGVYSWSERATQAYELSRKNIAEFIGADEQELVFTSGATASINMVVMAHLRHYIKENDVILLSPIEHHANLIPWQILAKSAGAKISYIKLNEDFSIDWDDFESKLDKAVLIAITQCSNVLGVKFDIEKIASYGVDVLVDGTQMLSHEKVDVKKLGCAFYAFSAHKMYGPTGIGGLYIDKKLHDKLKPCFTGGGMVEMVSYEGASFQEMPALLEAGTPNIGGAIGFASATRYIDSIGYSEIMAHEKSIMNYLLSSLEAFGLNTFSPMNNTVYSFEYPKVHAHDVATLLGEKNVMVRAGHHCCMPLMRQLGVNALSRVSIGYYNHQGDIDRLILALERVKKVML